MPPPWLHASHNRVKRECGSWFLFSFRTYRTTTHHQSLL